MYDCILDQCPSCRLSKNVKRLVVIQNEHKWDCSLILEFNNGTFKLLTQVYDQVLESPGKVIEFTLDVTGNLSQT